MTAAHCRSSSFKTWFCKQDEKPFKGSITMQQYGSFFLVCILEHIKKNIGDAVRILAHHTQRNPDTRNFMPGETGN